MRITRKAYEKARASVEAAREQIKLVRTWEDTVKRAGSLEGQELVAITVSEDGSVRIESQLSTRPSVQHSSDAEQTASKN